MERFLENELATEALGQALAQALGPPGPHGGGKVWLHGGLGAGKTALCRSLLRALGETGPVKSPIYTLMEPYDLPGRPCFHLDLYRLADPEELAFLGVRDLDEPSSLFLVEWPEQGRGFLPQPDLLISLSHQDAGRRVSLKPETARGQAILESLK